MVENLKTDDALNAIHSYMDCLTRRQGFQVPSFVFGRPYAVDSRMDSFAGDDVEDSRDSGGVFGRPPANCRR